MTCYDGPQTVAGSGDDPDADVAWTQSEKKSCTSSDWARGVAKHTCKIFIDWSNHQGLSMYIAGNNSEAQWCKRIVTKVQAVYSG